MVSLVLLLDWGSVQIFIEKLELQALRIFLLLASKQPTRKHLRESGPFITPEILYTLYKTFLNTGKRIRKCLVKIG